MRLTRFTDNALRCLTYLALVSPRSATIGEIADRLRMSEDHLLKVAGRLVQLGYVRSIRGRHGGLQLAQDADSIDIAAVIHATEDNLTLVPCFDPVTNDCPIASACTLAGALDDALQAFFGVLEGYTLADVVRQRRELEALVADVS